VFVVALSENRIGSDLSDKRETLRNKFLTSCFLRTFFTPKAFANFSPALERSDYAGEWMHFDLTTPKVLANAFGVMKQLSMLIPG
jgi:hypothetical protein